ncbi:LysR family transcriptional regulator [Chamaesiphon sp. OTE_20_metabat_361]|uniref:LysR family transcriptional regulator n=1 Tax=Chamaesiphon sp. OTE_20_metabat_361 TaxID=2964689 RepID=UPI00286AE2EB|nr:LysR family transcriptional regulator [Chamaesiphon sp. OTE_20_metabat_361]
MNTTEAVKAIELRDLRYFLAVVEAGSITSAAEKLHVAQPYLTRKIAALEKRLGDSAEPTLRERVELFDRKKRPHQLNQTGRAFLEAARVIVEKLDLAVENTHRIRLGEIAGKLGYLTVGFTSAMANGILPDILGAFKQNYPNISLILSEETSSNQIQRLRDRATDLMFVYQYLDLTESLAATADLDVLLLVRESLVVVLPARHPLADRSVISLADLRDESFIMPDRQVVPGLFKEIEGLCVQSKFVPNIALEAVFMVTILGLVAGEIGISILPASVQNLQRKGVVYKKLQERAVTNQLAAVWRRDNSSPILANFIKIIEGIIGKEI